MRQITKINIDTKYLPALSRVFSPIVMDSLAQKGYSAYLNEVCANSGILHKIDKTMLLSDFFDWIYNFLFRNYRNEYIYKNVIANKILLGKHSLNTSQMLTEFRVGKCKADAVVVNGTSTVYEIKSEFDSFARLKNQIYAYLQVFDNINVITSAPQARKLISELPECIGILVLTDRNTISTIRKSESNKKNITQQVLFDSLRKNEYMKIVKDFYGTVPDVPNTRIYRECKCLFCRIPSESAHDLTMAILGKRINTKLLKEFIGQGPDSLSSCFFNMSNNAARLRSLMDKLSMNIGTVLAPVIA
jgi:hypothetical protein